MYYRFYSLDAAGHVAGVRVYEADDDITALEAAQKLCIEAPIEIWDGPRLVAQLQRDGRAPMNCSSPA